MSNSSPSEQSTIHPQVEAAHVSAKAAIKNAKVSFGAAILSTVIAVVGTVVTAWSSDKAEGAASDARTSAQLVETAASFSNVPPGTVISWAGDLTPSNKSALAALGWRVCDGDPTFDSKQHPEYERWVARVWNASNDKSSTAKLPDLRGQFLRGTTAERQVADKQDGAVGHHRHFIAQLFNQVSGPTEDYPVPPYPQPTEADAVGEIAYTSLAVRGEDLGRRYQLMRAPQWGDGSHPGYVGQTSGNIENDPLKFDGKRADVVKDDSETRPANIAVHWLIYVGKPQVSPR